MKTYQRPISTNASISGASGQSSFSSSTRAFEQGFTKGLFGVNFFNQTVGLKRINSGIRAV